MRERSRRALGGAMACWAILLPSVGQALVEFHLDGAVIDSTEIAGSLYPVGTPVSALLRLDPAVTDSDPSPTRFQSGIAGDLTLDDPTNGPIVGQIAQVAADASTGEWIAQGTVTIFFDIPWVLTLEGLGLTPDQLLPEYSQFDGAEAVFDGGGTIGSVTLGFDTLTLIPEPSTGLLLALGLAGVAAVRRPRHPR